MKGALVDKALSMIAQVSRALRSIMHVTDMGSCSILLQRGACSLFLRFYDNTGRPECVRDAP